MTRIESSNFWWCAAAVPLLFACGGVATGGGSTASGGAAAGGGSTASGGAAAGASGGASAGAPGGSCEYYGKTYADGASFPASDGCNSCGCSAGAVGCTQIGCTATTCVSDGQIYQPGQSFKVGCNSCTCLPDGALSCTRMACPEQCDSLQEQYAPALKRMKECDPTQPNPCTKTLQEDLQCGCPTPVNANDVNDLKTLTDLAKQAADQCLQLPCPACVSPPGLATCTAAGSCEFAPFRPGEAACKVGGVVYPHGASGIREPSGCNDCSCSDGELNPCTKRACQTSDCPPDTLPGTQCAQCGPTDECQIVETACLPKCTDTCATGLCSQGLCRQVCG